MTPEPVAEASRTHVGSEAPIGGAGASRAAAWRTLGVDFRQHLVDLLLGEAVDGKIVEDVPALTARGATRRGHALKAKADAEVRKEASACAQGESDCQGTLVKRRGAPRTRC